MCCADLAYGLAALAIVALAIVVVVALPAWWPWVSYWRPWLLC